MGADNSLKLILDWAKKTDSPATVVDQVNAGLSQARMSGLTHARGDYIAFLDSDDTVTPGLYTRMARYAVQEQCDLVICRSVEFNDSNCHVSCFYDEWLWNDLLQNAPAKTTCLKNTPLLLRLEPNVNTRAMRREFMLAEGINFKRDLIFEDLPAHAHEIAAARRIGLINETGYHYRINRPGKITGERSLRRFHIFTSVNLAIQYARQYSIDKEAGAWLLNLMTRMIIWCGENVLLPHRLKFFEQVCELYACSPHTRG
ncbi:glycosyltransferase family 2 protein [Acetobacter thailandicus]|uniref:glycosyltransferase family 2 protein n=1 Tax=Acetobacter thailandicus TaxID=1502842 RepID=UPI00314514F5